MIPRLLLLSMMVLPSFFFTSVSAQGRKKSDIFKSKGQRIRHIQGIKGGDFSVGVAKYGYIYSGSGMFYISDDLSVNVRGVYEDSKVFSSDLNRYVGDFTLTYSLFDMNGFVYINGRAGVSANYVTSSSSKELSVKNGANFGALTGVELEFYLFGLTSVFVSVDQRYDVFKDWGHFRNYNMVGLRFNFK